MAFPTGWLRKCIITIPAAQIAGNNTDFPVLATEANFPTEMMDGGSNSALNGGGDVRFSEDLAGAVQVPCEIVSFITGGTPSAEVHLKLPTVNTGADKTYYVWYKKAGEVQPAVTAAFGRNAVWSDYEFVSHNSRIDSTGNHILTDTGNSAGGPESALNPFGKTADCDFLSATDRVMSTAQTIPNLSSYTFQTWYYYNANRSGNQAAAAYRGSGRVTLVNGTEWAGNNGWLGSSGAPGTTAWRMSHYTHNSLTQRIAYRDGVVHATDNTVNDYNDKSYITIGAGSLTTGESIDGRVYEVRLKQGVATTGWITTEYNNQSDPAAFATAGTPEAVGGGAQTVSISDGTSSHLADSISLSQGQTLAVAGAGQSLASDNLTFVQSHTLAPQAGNQGISSDEALLSQLHTLIITDGVLEQTAGSISLGQGQLLMPGGSKHEITCESPSILQSHILSIIEAANGLVSDEAILAQIQALVIQNATHGLTSDVAGLFDPGTFTPNPERVHKATGTSRMSSALSGDRRIQPTNNRTLRI